MKLKRLPKEKRNALVLVALLTVGTVAGLGLGLIRPQYEHLAKLRQSQAAAKAKLAQMKDASKHTDDIEAQAAQAEQALGQAEKGMATGDLYDWVINTVRQFKAGYQVEILQIGTPTPPAPVNLLPGIPYLQSTLSVVGTAHFHDLGRFLAEFENAFPDIRLVNLSLEPAALTGAGAAEKLYFKLDLVTLVKINPA